MTEFNARISIEPIGQNVFITIHDEHAKKTIMSVSMTAADFIGQVMIASKTQGDAPAKAKLEHADKAGKVQQNRVFEVFIPTPDKEGRYGESDLIAPESQKARWAENAIAKCQAKREGWSVDDIQATVKEAWSHEGYIKPDIVNGEKGHWAKITFYKYVVADNPNLKLTKI